jgi:hypothetical protein
MATNTTNNSASNVKLSSRSARNTRNVNAQSFDFLSSKALRLTALYWLVLVNVGLSYLFIHILGRI